MYNYTCAVYVYTQYKYWYINFIYNNLHCVKIQPILVYTVQVLVLI